MFLSILVYGGTALILCMLARRMVLVDNISIQTNGHHSSMWNSAFLLSILVFATIAGARYNTGLDHTRYLESYLMMGNVGIIEDEVGFYAISRFLSSMGFHYFFFFALWAAMQITFVYLACKERRELLPYTALLIMLGPYFLEWMNGIRQCIVECYFVFIVSSQQCSKKNARNYILYFLLVLLATTFHRSALLLVPLLILAQFNIPLNNRWVNIAIAAACVALGMTPLWTNLFSDNAVWMLEFLGYDRYASHYDSIMDVEDFTNTAFGPLRLSSLIVDFFIIFFYPKIRAYYSNDSALKSFFLFFFMGVCAYNLFANTNMMFLRPIAYLTVFKLPMLAYLLCFLKKTKNDWFYIVAILAFTYALIEVLKSGLMGVKEYNLYHFYFMNDMMI